MGPCCERDVTPKTKNHIYYAIVKITITYAAETGCLKYNYICSRNRVFKSTITYAAETGCLKVQLHMQQKQGV